MDNTTDLFTYLLTYGYMIKQTFECIVIAQGFGRLFPPIDKKKVNVTIYLTI